MPGAKACTPARLGAPVASRRAVPLPPLPAQGAFWGNAYWGVPPGTGDGCASGAHAAGCGGPLASSQALPGLGAPRSVPAGRGLAAPLLLVASDTKEGLGAVVAQLLGLGLAGPLSLGVPVQSWMGWELRGRAAGLKGRGVSAALAIRLLLPQGSDLGCSRNDRVRQQRGSRKRAGRVGIFAERTCRYIKTGIPSPKRSTPHKGPRVHAGSALG